MNDPKDIAIADYDYTLPEERISKRPLAQRDQSKLLVYKNGAITEETFCNIPDLLPQDTMLVFNNTRVIHARLVFRKETGSMIEIFCLEPYMAALSEAFEQREQCSWLCFVGNNKKWKSGELSKEIDIAASRGCKITLSVTRKEPVGNAWVVEFRWNGGISFAELIEHAGVVPLPPYLHREADADDNTRYQTVYADPMGSVAAPTAGLHFTDNIFNKLRAKHIPTEFLTLHVGAGTFKPVSSATIGGHDMHSEKIAVDYTTIKDILKHDGKTLIAIGTTSVRTLESIYWFGVQLHSNPSAVAMHISQWEPYETDAQISMSEAYSNVLNWLDRQSIDTLYGETRLIIAPGYTYHVINGMVTNFHQPKSTLLLLVSALIGDSWKACYQYALDHDFRFLSYGDSCLFLPHAE